MLGQVDKDVIALSLLSAGEMAHSYSAFCPSAFTIRNWVVQGSPHEIEANLRNLRSGYLPAAAFGVALSAVVSYIAKSPLPLIFAAGTGVLMLALYEHAIPAEHRLLSLSSAPQLRLAQSQPGDIIDLQPSQWREVPNFA